jgi:hypothetical protein
LYLKWSFGVIALVPPGPVILMLREPLVAVQRDHDQNAPSADAASRQQRSASHGSDGALSRRAG